ncbi:MAG TPA: alpha-amylase family glycosyl hydrolase [Methanothrix sp.]|nr:alpha-amylase family glycosyl hydrolase [Methanothrix sp.]
MSKKKPQSFKAQSLKEVDFKPLGPVFPSPPDWRDQFLYHLLVDRFNDGQKRKPYRPGVPQERKDAAGERWQGGNLKGITEKLDYIKNLGCTAIWLSPIFKNRIELHTYHGYGIQNYLEVDPRFGSEEDLRRLVGEAHKKGLRVILDVVLNHTGDNWAYPGDYTYYYWEGVRFPFGFWRQVEPSAARGECKLRIGDFCLREDEKARSELPFDDAVWPREFQNREWYRRKGEIRNWDAFPETRDGDFCSLKELDTSNPQVLRALIDSFKRWIAVADVDGYRLDAAKHIEESSTAIFCNAIREYAQSIGKNNFFLFGEVVGGDLFIDQYIGRNARIPDTNERFPSLDAALDFPLWSILEAVIKGFMNPASLRQRYDRFRELYADHGGASRYFVSFVDNHDQIGRSPRARFLHNDPYQEQAVLAVGYLLTSLGIPCIYYGTEQGFDGGGDGDRYIRECMFGGSWGAFGTIDHHFFDQDHRLYREISLIAGIRAKEPALRYGRQYFREISGNGADFGHPIDGLCTLAYSRILDDTEILMALNLDQSPRSDFVTVDGNLTPAGRSMENLLGWKKRVEVLSTGGRHVVQLPLEGYEMAILKLAD